MPRDPAGAYTLPPGINPVVDGTVIEPTWANPTMEDIANALTNSLSRNGQGGMLAPFRFTDGTEALPGAAFSNEPGSGLWREGAGNLGMAILGVNVTKWQAGTFTVLGKAAATTSYVGKPDGTAGLYTANLAGDTGLGLIAGSSVLSATMSVSLNCTALTLSASTSAWINTLKTGVNMEPILNGRTLQVANNMWVGDSAGNVSGLQVSNSGNIIFLTASNTITSAATGNVPMKIFGSELEVRGFSGDVNIFSGNAITNQPASGSNFLVRRPGSGTNNNILSGSLTALYYTSGTPTIGYEIGADYLKIRSKNGTERITLSNANQMLFLNLPTTSAGLVAGAVWRSGNQLMIV